MRIRIRNELLLIDILTVILILIISFFPLKPLRIVLGLPFILFFPGYTLIAALFPRKSDLDAIERVALSFGLSIAVVPLIGLVLNYTPWGIRLYPILISLSLFIFGTSAIAWQRRRRLVPSERLSLAFNLSLQWGGSSKLDRVLSIILVMAILGAIGTLAYVIATPKVGERFTEFYILGLSRKAEGYPRELKLGEEGKVILGIINREHEPMGYKAEIRINGVKNKEIGPIKLNHDEKWEEVVSFLPQKVGENQKVEFILYKIRELGKEGKHTLLTLRFDKDKLSLAVANQAPEEASYRVKVTVEGEKKKTWSKALGPVNLAKGEKWAQELEFPSSFREGSRRVEFLLYRNDKLLYKEKVEGSYPSLHLWVDVKKKE